MRKTLIATGLAAVVAAAAVTAAAQTAQTPEEEAVKMRQGIMTAVKWQFAPIGAVVKGEAPNGPHIAEHAGHLAALARLAPQGFAVESDFLPNTKAKSEIWERPEEFAQRLQAFQAETSKLAEVARNGDERALKVQFAAVANACKNCHETFRAE